MFLRLLIWFGLIAAAWWFFKPRPRIRPPASTGASHAAGQGAPRPLPKVEAMVDCARCGLHLPASEALHDGAGRVYCSVEHRAVGPRARA